MISILGGECPSPCPKNPMLVCFHNCTLVRGIVRIIGNKVQVDTPQNPKNSHGFLYEWGLMGARSLNGCGSVDLHDVTSVVS